MGKVFADIGVNGFKGIADLLLNLGNWPGSTASARVEVLLWLAGWFGALQGLQPCMAG